MKKYLLSTFAALLAISFCCSSCDSNNGENPVTDKTVTIENFEKDGDKFACIVKNECETYSFVNKVTVPKNYSWKLYNDIEGQQEVVTKTVTLNTGHNNYYLLVLNNIETIGFYTVDIYRNHMYTVYFSTGGGTTIPSQQVEENEYVTQVNDPSKTGYTFDGWDFDLTQKITSNTTVNAKWIANKIKINFDVNGGDALENSTIIVDYDSRVNLPTPHWYGHDFLGWYIGDQKISSGKWNKTEEVTLVAKWEVVEYDFYINTDGGSYKGQEFYSTKITYGENYSLDIPTKTGYTFIKWIKGEEDFPASGTYLVEDYTIITAIWEANSYTLNLDVNSGDQLPTSELQVTFDSYFTLPTPTKTGYNFMGWYNNEELVESGKWSFTSDITLKAHWEAKKIKVNLSHSSSLEGNIIKDYKVKYEKAYNDIVTITYSSNILSDVYIPESTSSHYFAGWFTDSNHTQPFDPNVPLTQTETTLYAKWLSVSGVDLYYCNQGKAISTIAPTLHQSYMRFNTPVSGKYLVTIKPMFTNTTDLSNFCFTVTKESTGIYSDPACNITFNENENEIEKSCEIELIGGKAYYLNGYFSATKHTTVELKYEVSLTLIDKVHCEGTKLVDSLEVTYDSNFNLGIALEKGKRMIGWYTEENGQGVKLTDNKGDSLTPWTYTNIDTVYPYLVNN